MNRAGTPLLEIVSEPEMRSAAEAVGYARALHSLVVWLGICDGNMQEGSFRVDANVSVRPKGQKEFGTRCELKNINSFRFLERAIQYEARRQIELIEDGGKVIQETRLYDSDRDETRSMRSKEDAHDYRYFPILICHLCLSAKSGSSRFVRTCLNCPPRNWLASSRSLN